MVTPTPASNEPAGSCAAYMSTVDFQSSSHNDPYAASSYSYGNLEGGYVDHGPTDLPPKQYIGGADAISPWKPRKNLGTIPGSALDYVSTRSQMVRISG